VQRRTSILQPFERQLVALNVWVSCQLNQQIASAPVTQTLLPTAHPAPKVTGPLATIEE
jgi:hypothetical protein